VLALPRRRVEPGVADGHADLPSDAGKELSVVRREAIDPRPGDCERAQGALADTDRRERKSPRPLRGIGQDVRGLL